MDVAKLKETLPLVLGQTFLFVFIQKFLFGINAYEPPGMSLYEYYGIFLIALCVLIFGYSLVAARDRARLPSKKVIASAGALAFLAGIFLLFDIPDLFMPEARLGMMAACLIVLSVAFCPILFVWLNKLKQESLSLGVRSVLLSVLGAAFVYSVITPSDVNDTPYMAMLEVVSLPLVALCSAIPWAKPLAKHRRTKPANAKGKGYLISATLFLFVMLLISYVDVLNEGYPDSHYEHPTFYALLLIGIALIIGVLYKGGEEESIVNGATQSLIQFLGVFFLLAYIFIFFYASSSYEFCFQFTCFVRRFVAIVFFVVVLSLTFIYDFKIEFSIGIMFLVPYFLAKALMMFFYLPVSTGALADSSDFRLTVLLVLGVLLIFAVGYSWYFHKRSSGVSALFEQGEQVSAQSLLDAARSSAVAVLAQRYALSKREEEILYFLSMGYSVSKVAALLFIANNTVGTHVRSIYKKMKLHNKQEAIDVVNKTIGLNPDKMQA